MSFDKTIISDTQPAEASAIISSDVNIDGYTIKRFIARGGMASVYLARQEVLGRDVALKVMDKNDDDTFIERFLNEGRLVASMSHPNVITIYDLGVLEDGRAYLSMEFIDGGDLESRLKKSFTEVQVLAVLNDLAACLAYVHEHDVIHRDIKPANILFRKDGTLVLTDFGIARQIDQDIALTRDGVAVGSPGYMSPEQAQAKKVDLRTDIYSVGVIFSEMLLGENQFSADSYIQTSMNHIQMDIPNLPMAICQYQILLDKLLAKDPTKRFSNAPSVLRFMQQLPDAEDRVLPLSDEEQVSALHEVTGEFAIDARESTKDAGLYASSGSWIIALIFCALLGGGLWLFRLYVIPIDYLPSSDKVAAYVLKADKAYQADKLLVPKGSSAVDYYRKALSFDENNTEAKAGLDNIVQRYIALAKKAAKAKNRSKLRTFVNRGLSVDRGDRQLKQLKKQYKL